MTPHCANCRSYITDEDNHDEVHFGGSGPAHFHKNCTTAAIKAELERKMSGITTSEWFKNHVLLK